MQQSTHSFGTTLLRLLITFGMFMLYGLADALAMVPVEKTKGTNLALLGGVHSIGLSISFYALVIWLAWWLYHNWLRKDQLSMYGHSRFNWWKVLVIYLGIVGIFAEQFFSVLIRVFVALNKASNQVIVEDLLGAFPVVMTLTAVIGAPILEEYIFRGLLMASFPHQDRWAWVLLSGVASSALFGLAHTGFAEPLAWVSYSLMGAVYVGAYAATKDLRYPILLHVINNAYGVIMVFLRG